MFEGGEGAVSTGDYCLRERHTCNLEGDLFLYACVVVMVLLLYMTRDLHMYRKKGLLSCERHVDVVKGGYFYTEGITLVREMDPCCGWGLHVLLWKGFTYGMPWDYICLTNFFRFFQTGEHFLDFLKDFIGSSKLYQRICRI